MIRLIDADALWMDIIHVMGYCDDILEIIEQQPTVEQKTGKWIYLGHGYKCPWSCSNCGSCNEERTDYCSDCGSYNGGGRWIEKKL